MNVDWGWIKQRPHFLAEKLSSINNVTLLYPFSWRRRGLVKNKNKNISPLPIFYIPFGRKFHYIYKLNKIITRVYLYFLSKNTKYDYLWLSSVEIYDYIPLENNIPLIYDLMDDVVEFKENLHRKKFLIDLEANLVKKCKLIFCSSQYLSQKKINQHGHHEKFQIINNAVDKKFHSNIPYNVTVSKRDYKICYVGTISNWLDLEALNFIVDNFKNISVDLIGPVNNNDITLQPRKNINFKCQIEHINLPNIMSKYDCFIMPFIKSELIYSVDPVKLYEYICFGRPIISINYPEVHKFKKFVFYYNDKSELINIIKYLIDNNFNINSFSEDRTDFLNKNNWESRVYLVQEFLHEYINNH
jgi:hypothetical protein